MMFRRRLSRRLIRFGGTPLPDERPKGDNPPPGDGGGASDGPSQPPPQDPPPEPPKDP